MIELTNIKKAYSRNHSVLNGLSASFQQGKVYGVIGENGAGKTTLFRCMVGLESYDGHIRSQWQPLKDHIGYLPTELYFFEKLKAKEYISFLCKARGIVHAVLEEKNIFGLPLNHYISSYSTGMKKKLALLAILLQKNDIFILDEPFNGVDIQSNILITEIIHRLRDRGKTVLISSHIFSTLTDTCDEILHLKEGRFIKTYLPPEYTLLESEMKSDIFLKKLDVLDF